LVAGRKLVPDHTCETQKLRQLMMHFSAAAQSKSSCAWCRPECLEQFGLSGAAGDLSGAFTTINKIPRVVRHGRCGGE